MGGPGSGGRFHGFERDASEILPSEALAELKELLRKLMPEGDQPAWAMRRFSGGKDRFACVAVSYGGFADADRRDGVLNHARVVKLEPESAWVDPYPLVALAAEFEIKSVLRRDAVDRLQSYVDAVAEEDVTVRALSRQELKSVPRELLHDVILGTLTGIADARVRRRVRMPQGPLPQIARAWAALPVGLQRRSSWAYGVADGVPVQIIWTADAAEVNVDGPSRAVKDCAAKYTEIVFDSNYDLSNYVKNEQIDLGGFSQDVQRMAATVAATLPETKAMSTKKSQKGESRSGPRGETLAEGDVAELNRQYERILDSLKEYVDLRLEAYETGRPAKALQPSKTRQGFMQQYGIALGAIGGVLLTIVIFFAIRWFQERQSVRTNVPQVPQQESGVLPQSETETEAADVPQTNSKLRALISSADASGQWKEAFLALTEQEPALVGGMIEDAILHPSSGSAADSTLANFRDRLLGNGKKLASADREALRKYLLQYIGALEASAADPVIIDEGLSDLSPVLMRSIKVRTKTRSASDKAEDFELQSEIILRWLEANPA